MKRYENVSEKDFAVDEDIDIEEIEDALAQSEYLPKQYKDASTENLRKSSRKRLNSRNWNLKSSIKSQICKF